MSGSTLLRWTVHFTGHVQGVGFRYNAMMVARHYEVCGTVENLPDGRVRMVAEGTPSTLEAFINDVAESTRGHVENMETSTSPATGEFSGFEAIH